MKYSPAALALLFFSALANASVADDAKFFLLPGEQFVDIAKAQGSLLVFKGSNGTLVVLDESTGRALGSEEAIQAIRRVNVSISPAEADKLNSLALAFSGSVASCGEVYNNFSSGKGSNCFENTYFKYRCGYLWDQGLWRGIIPFSIVDARKQIEGGIATMKRASGVLVQAGEAFGKSEFSSAGSASSAVEEAKPAAKAFVEWHARMLSYSVFATDGRLNRCEFKAGVLDELSAIVGSQLDVGTPERRQAAERRLSESLERGLANYYYARAISKLEEYSYDALSFNNDFSAIRSAKAYFTLSDEELLREATGKINGTAEQVSRAMAEFNTLATGADEKLAKARDALAEYKRASEAVKAASLSASNNSRKLVSESSQAIAKKAFDLETDFIVLEQEMRLRGNASAKEFMQLSAKAAGVQNELALAVLSSQSISGRLLGLSTAEIVGLALLTVLGVALSYQYYRSKHHY